MTMTITYHKDIGLWYPDYAKSPQDEVRYINGRIKDADLVLRFLKPTQRGTVVQAGGHVGTWPERLSKHFDTVISVEPEPQLYNCLVQNTSHRENVITFNRALGAQDAEVLLLRRASPGTCRIDIAGDIKVKQTTIDQIVEGHEVNALILDVEGYEVQALRGAVSTIANWNPVIHVEMLPRSKEAIHAYLTKLCYRLRLSVHNDAIYTR